METIEIETKVPMESRHDDSGVEDESAQARLNSRRTKLLFLVDSFLPHAGGSRVYYFNLLKNLVSAYPDEVTVLTKKVPGWEEFDHTELNNSLRVIRSGKPLPNMKYQHLPKIVLPLALAAKHIAVGKYDVIHAGDLYPQGVIAMWFRQFFGIPYVAYAHGEEITSMEGRRFQPYIRDMIYHRAETVIANSEFTRQHLLRIGVDENRIRTITPGVDYERFTPKPRNPELVKKYGLEGKIVLLTVSRLTARKGHDFVMQSLAALGKDRDRVKYLIVGKGSELERLRQLAAELGVADSVVFVGFVPNEQLSDFYDLSDIFIMPNRDEDGDLEGFGMVFLEAGAASKPVIGGDSGGTADAILEGITGFRVDSKNVDEITNALRTLVSNDTLREEMGRAGYLRARNDFSWPSRGKMLHEVNLEVLSKCKR